MYGYGMYGFLDPTFLLVILGLVICEIRQRTSIVLSENTIK